MPQLRADVTSASPEMSLITKDHGQRAQECLSSTKLQLGQWEPLPALRFSPVPPTLRRLEFGKTLHCLEVLQAVQQDSRTAGWYWGDVRGKVAVGAATAALVNRGLIHAVVGPPPFRLTPKGEEFLGTHRTAWEAFLAKTDRQSTVETFAQALLQLPEESTAVSSL